MEYSEQFKTKKQVWLERSVILAFIIIIILFLIFAGLNDNQLYNNGKSSFTEIVKYVIVFGVLFLLFKFRSKEQPAKTDESIIKFVADELYNKKGIYLKTIHSNVRVQRGAPTETYVEFIEECITFLYIEYIGIVERYPGETIKNIKLGKQQDEIQMKLADIGIARKRHMDKLESMGLTEEENK